MIGYSMTLREAYRVFGLPSTAEWAHVKQAYRRRARQSHPDRFGHGTAAYYAAEERFKRVNQAYERLRVASEQRRRRVSSASTSSPAPVRRSVLTRSPADARKTNTSNAPARRHGGNPFHGLPPGWMRVLGVTGAVSIFCLGLLWSDSLAAMLAWTASWTVLAVGAYSLSARPRS